MRVMEVVRLAADRYDEGPEGKVIAVGGRRNGRVTVKWDDGKTTEHGRGPQARLQPVLTPSLLRQVCGGTYRKKKKCNEINHLGAQGAPKRGRLESPSKSCF